VKGLGKFDIPLMGCAVSMVILVGVAGMTVIGLIGGGAIPSKADEEEQNSVQGDVEFWITHYDPAQGGINGRDCGGSAGKICSDKSSPTGYTFTRNGKKLDTGAIAVPQDSANHSKGKVDINNIPVPLIHDKVERQAKIIIPGYNNSKPTIVGDHFASKVTKANRLDLACSTEKWREVSAYWNKNKLILDSGRGYNGGSKIMGKIEGGVIKN